MFWTRFRSSCILMVITIAAMVLGGEVLFAVLLCVSLIGMMELYRVVGVHKSLPAAVGYLACVGYYALVYFERLELQTALFLGFLLLLLAAYVLGFPKWRTEQVTLLFFGLFYVAVLLSYIYRVRIAEGGAYTVWLIFIGAWGSDTCAYVIGCRFGKHKLAPVLSPKKSIEGCIGGIVGAALIGFIYAAIFRAHITGVANPMLAYAVIGGCSSVLSQIGDLAASAIKRNHEVKDYGRLIPGHGGILDRFDSVIVTAPLVYGLMQLLG